MKKKLAGRLLCAWKSVLTWVLSLLWGRKSAVSSSLPDSVAQLNQKAVSFCILQAKESVFSAYTITKTTLTAKKERHCYRKKFHLFVIVINSSSF